MGRRGVRRPLIVWVLSSHGARVPGVRTPIGHWPLVLVRRRVVTRVGPGVGVTRTKTRDMAGCPGLTWPRDVEDPFKKDTSSIL